MCLKVYQNCESHYYNMLLNLLHNRFETTKIKETHWKGVKHLEVVYFHKGSFLHLCIDGKSFQRDCFLYRYYEPFAVITFNFFIETIKKMNNFVTCGLGRTDNMFLTNAANKLQQ
ncbi:unnamed protein product [Clavelina lepadiformis]|uniref:LAGLIDADG endonuclease n=1 Tax=Clavelina lepadiformis TaxID=159417 RepID=A0ABP0GE85_CLALP